MIAAVAVVLVTLTRVLASSYMEFCDPIGLQDRADQGVILQAQCGNGGAKTCQELDIVSCLANAWGAIVPSGHTHGNFNGTCIDCELGMSRNETELYGLLQCQCANGTANSVVNATYQTNDLIRYESKLGMLCPYGNNSAVRSLDCSATLQDRTPSHGWSRKRHIRHFFRASRMWQTD